MTTVADLLFGALSEIRVARAGDVLEPEAQTLALAILNEYLDLLNAGDRAIYATQQPSFVLTPNLQPHTIGLVANAPTWNTTIARPTKIEAANIILTGNIRRPINIRDNAWWMALRAPAITAAIPTDLNYTPDWPNGTVKFYPVPLTAYSVEFTLNTLFGSLLATDTFDLPPGYLAAIRLSLAELLAPAFGQGVSEQTKTAAKNARGVVWGVNDALPNLRTRDAGMPGGRRGRGYDYRTGLIGGR